MPQLSWRNPSPLQVTHGQCLGVAAASAQGAEIVCFPEAYLPGLRGQNCALFPFEQTQQKRARQAIEVEEAVGLLAAHYAPERDQEHVP